MKKRQLGHDGPEVGAIGLGCMRMSNFQGTTTSRRSPGDAESVATIEAALDAGINFLDTGDFYGMGHNELLISRAIKERRDDAFLSVKFGAQKSPSGAFLGADLRPNSVKTFAAYPSPATAKKRARRTKGRNTCPRRTHLLKAARPSRTAARHISC